ncbi:Ku protein [Paenibacillus anaericanus]
MGFGLVHIPVKLYAATKEKELALHMLYRDCPNSENMFKLQFNH